ncbi:hypothetical protein BCR44DRAFT_1424139 [Catenaria anguillulae PL171]|uniref:Uncharacterized protein n=1 Tax=Catenaria anguillulae PL171 TaxID=765915 RepID=A0A1Y2I296_9FUNG|nr:hypothetical protein BCR44DRAFT_1424139 [Catenaria anguillulae PL171]
MGNPTPDDRIDEKLGTRQARRPASHDEPHDNSGINQHLQEPTERSDQSVRPKLVQSNPNSRLANAARMSLERLALSGDHIGRRSSVSAKLMRWMHDYPPFGHDLTVENVNATWMSTADVEVDPLRVKIKAHINMAKQVGAKCSCILKDGFQQLTAGSIHLTDFIDIAVHAMCLEESWDLLGHFQYISVEQVQLFWIQKCAEDWRRSDEGLLCSSHLPLFGNPEALLYLLAAPGQSNQCRIMAIHELAAMDQGTWTRCVDELAILQLLETLVELPNSPKLCEMILALLSRLAGLGNDTCPGSTNHVGRACLDSHSPTSVPNRE